MGTHPTIAVVLAGCGVYDGSEIHEAVLTLLAIDRAGAHYACFAPDIPQMHVVNHLSGEPVPGAERNVLEESARIARGRIQDLKEYRAADFDALIFPGGFGAAKNLCTFGVDGPDAKVDPEVARAINETRAADKPIGALCISPALLVKVLGAGQVTIGQDAGTANAIQAMGGRHVEAGHGEVVVDEAAKLVTTPCYMLNATISQIAEGADAAVKKLIALCA